jgi:hypothetical protein
VAVVAVVPVLQATLDAATSASIARYAGCPRRPR